MTERTFFIRHRLACVLVHVDFCFECYERVCVNLYSVWLLTFRACTITHAHTRARAPPLSSWIYSKTGAPNQQWKYDFSKMTFCDVTAAIDVRMRHRIGWLCTFLLCSFSFLCFFLLFYFPSLFFGGGGAIAQLTDW